MTVTTPGGTSAAAHKGLFKYFPTVAGVSPGTGSSLGGTSVTVTGQGFSPGATAFAFGSAKVQSVECTSDTSCTVLAPAHAAGTVNVTAAVDRKLKSPIVPGDQFEYD